jgi:hypothetical protein
MAHSIRISHGSSLQAILATLFKMFGYDFEGFRLLGTLWSLLAGVLLAILVKGIWKNSICFHDYFSRL